MESEDDQGHEMKIDIDEAEIEEHVSLGSNGSREEPKEVIRHTRSGRKIKPTLKSFTYNEELKTRNLDEIKAELERLKKIAAERWPEKYKAFRAQKTNESPQSMTVDRQDNCFDRQNSCNPSTPIRTYERKKSQPPNTPSGNSLNSSDIKEENDETSPCNESSDNNLSTACNDEEYILPHNIDKNVLRILESLQRLENQKKIIIEQNNIIINRNKKILDLLKSDGPDLDLSKASKVLEDFPLMTVEEFDHFNKNADNELVQRIYKYLKHMRAKKLRIFLHQAMKLLMTDELVSKFSWVGCNNMQKFGDTKMANILYLAAVKCDSFRGPTTKSEFKHEMVEVLRAIKQRYKGRSKKTDEELLLAKISRLEKLQQKDSGVQEDNNALNLSDFKI